MIPAVIIVGVPAAVSAIPDALHRLHALWLPAVQIVQKALLHRLAPAVLPGYRNLQGLVDQVLLCRHDVGDVPECPGIKRGCIDMHMDPAAFVRKRTRFPQLPDQLLDRHDILIPADRADHFRPVFRGCVKPGFSFFSLGFDTGITHKFPFPLLLVLCRIGIIIGPHIIGRCAKVCRCHFCRPSPADPGQFDLNAELLVLQLHACTPPLPSGYSGLHQRPPAFPNSLAL